MGNKFREKVVEEDLVAPKLEATPKKQAPQPEPEANQEEARRRKSQSGKAVKGVAKVLGGDLLGDRMVLKQIPLLLLCLFYLLLIVGNRYHIESLSREKQATEERINFLREHRIQMQKQYQQSVKISQIAEDLRDRGVGITAGPPYEISD